MAERSFFSPCMPHLRPLSVLLIPKAPGNRGLSLGRQATEGSTEEGTPTRSLRPRLCNTLVDSDHTHDHRHHRHHHHDITTTMIALDSIVIETGRDHSVFLKVLLPHMPVGWVNDVLKGHDEVLRSLQRNTCFGWCSPSQRLQFQPAQADSLPTLRMVLRVPASAAPLNGPSGSPPGREAASIWNLLAWLR